jgi:AraC family transcriptional regulator
MRFPFGAFYGELQKRAEVAGVRMTETVYPARARLPLHAHESLYFCLVLHGSYEETVARKQRLCRPAMLVFHPAGEAHANKFGDDGGACFNLEFSASWIKRIGDITCRLDEPAVFRDAATTGLASRLRREFLLMDDVSALAIESLALEIIVAVARRRMPKVRPGTAPAWLRQAEELIRARFAGSLKLNEIAAAIRRHPVHLARQFRCHHGCTIGDYVRSLRIGHACRRLTSSDEPLVTIALNCGFSGQAHFSTFFRRATGFTPAKYRETFRER